MSGVNQDKSFANPAPCGHSSNWGSHVDLAAPFTAYSTYPNNGYATLCGTSMATPHVSGAAALVWAHNPSWTNQQIVDRLFATAEDRGDPGRDDLFGYGIANVADAVGVPLTGVILDGPSTVPNGYAADFTAHPTGGTSPFTYTWRVDGVVQQQSSSNSFSWAASSSYSLSVTVQDVLLATASTSRDITVCPGFEIHC